MDLLPHRRHSDEVKLRHRTWRRDVPVKINGGTADSLKAMNMYSRHQGGLRWPFVQEMVKVLCNIYRCYLCVINAGWALLQT